MEIMNERIIPVTFTHYSFPAYVFGIVQDIYLLFFEIRLRKGLSEKTEQSSASSAVKGQ